MKNFLFSKQNLFEKTIYFFSILFLIVISLGKFDRYLLSERLAIAVNFEKFNSFYPNLNNVFEVYNNTAYFPGGAILVYFFKKLIPDFLLLEVIFILSAFVIILFFFLVKKILYKTYRDKVELQNFWLISIIYTLIFCKYWLWFGTSFKLDTLAFSLIILAFLISNIYEPDYKKNMLKLFISTFLILFAISIKQQAIVLIPAMVIFSLINKNFFFKIYSLMIITFSCVVYLYFYDNEFIWFWAIERMGQDPLHSFSNLIRIYYKQFFLVSSAIIIFFLNIYFKIIDINFSQKKDIFKKRLKNNFFFILLFFFSISGMISGLKSGGGTGNTELSLILIYPLIYLFLTFLNKNTLMVIVTVLLFNFTTEVASNVKNYYETKKYQILVTKTINEKNIKILAEKQSYFALYTKERDNEVHFFDTFVDVHKYQFGRNNPNLHQDVLKKIIRKNYDYIVLRDISSNKDFLKKDYDLIIKNNLGNIFKKKI